MWSIQPGPAFIARDIPTSAATPSRTPFFSDGFESGNFTNWDSHQGELFEVIGGAAHTGSFGAHATATAGTSGNDLILKTFSAPGSNIVELSVYVKFNTLTGNSSGQLRVLTLHAGAGDVCGLNFVNFVANIRVRGKDGTSVNTNLTTNLTADATWHLIQMRYDGSGTNPITTLLVDGVTQATYTDTSSGSLVMPTELWIRLREQASQAGGDIYVDDVALYNT